MRQADIPLNKLFVSDLNTRKDLQAGQEDSGLGELAASMQCGFFEIQKGGLA